MAKVTIPIPKGPLKNIVKLPEDENVIGAGGSGVGDKGIYEREARRALQKSPDISLDKRTLLPKKGIGLGKRDKVLQDLLGYDPRSDFSRQQKRLENIEEEQKKKEKEMGALAPKPVDSTPDTANVALLKGQKADLQDVDRTGAGYLMYPFSDEGGARAKKLVSGWYSFNPKTSYTTRAFLGGINKEGKIEEGKGKVNDPKEYYEFTVQMPWSTKPAIWHLDVPPTEKIRNQLIQQAKDEYLNQSPAARTKEFLTWSRDNIRHVMSQFTESLGGGFKSEFATESLIGMFAASKNHQLIERMYASPRSRLSGLAMKGGQLKSPVRPAMGKGFVPIMQMLSAMFADWSSEFALQQTGVFPKDDMTLWMMPFMGPTQSIAGWVYRGAKGALAKGPLTGLARQNRAQRAAVKWLNQFSDSAHEQVLKSQRMRESLGINTKIVNSKALYDRLDDLYPDLELPTGMLVNYDKALNTVLEKAKVYIDAGDPDAELLRKSIDLFKKTMHGERSIRIKVGKEVVTIPSGDVSGFMQFKSLQSQASRIGDLVRTIGNKGAKDVAEKHTFGPFFDGAAHGRTLFEALSSDLDGFLAKHGRGSTGKKLFDAAGVTRRRMDKGDLGEEALGWEWIRAKRAEFRKKGLKIPSEFRQIKRKELQKLYDIKRRGNLTFKQEKLLENYEFGRKIALSRTTRDTARVLRRYKQARDLAKAEYVAADWNDVLNAAGLNKARWINPAAKIEKEEGMLGHAAEIDFGKVIQGFRGRAFTPDGEISSIWGAVISEKDIKKLDTFLSWMETQATLGKFGAGGLVIRGRSANIADRVMTAMLGGTIAGSALGAIPTAAAATMAAQLPEILQRWTSRSRLGSKFLENIIRRPKMTKRQQVQMAQVMASTMRQESEKGVDIGETKESIRRFLDKDVPLFLAYINKPATKLFEYTKMGKIPTGGKIDLGIIQKQKVMGTFDAEKEKLIQNYMNTTGADRRTAERRMTFSIEQQNEKELKETVSEFDNE